jgi:hypothetical protein
LVGIRAAIVTVRREEDGSDEMDPRVGEKARARVRGEKLSSGSAVGLEMGRKGGFQSSRVFLFFSILISILISDFQIQLFKLKFLLLS